MSGTMRRKDRIALRQALGAHVRGKFEASKAAWQPEFRKMLDCIRTVRGLPLCVDPDDDSDAASDISYPVIPAIVTAVLALIRDVFGTAINAPFTCEPTTAPDLPSHIKDWLMQLLMQNMDQLQAMTGGDPTLTQQAVDGMQQAAKAQIDERARDAANSIEAEVKERLFEAEWTSAFKDFLWNYVVYPIAVMKGPYLAPVKVRQWDPYTNRLTFSDEQRWVVEAVNPFSFLPAPYARDAQTCEYVVEVRRTTALDFARLAIVDGYDAQNIESAQVDYPDGRTETFWTGDDRDPDRDLLQFAAPATMADTGVYDIICFYGRVPGSMLNAMSDLGLVEWQWYEAEVEVVGDYVIRAALNNRPDGRRPFNTLAFEPIAGSIYGESVATRLFDTQRTCEATVREILRNMAFSSGPIGEVDITRVDPDDPWDILEPRMLKPVKPGIAGQNGTAYTFHDIENNVPALQNILEYFKNSGFEIIGFNRMSLGGMPGGSVGRTSGGMSMVLNQSSKPVKLKVSDIGQHVIVPTVQGFLDILLMTSPDPTIQGDIRVHPKGVEGLVDNEALSSDILMAMQTLAPVAQALQSGSPVAQEMLSLFYYWAKLNNIPTGSMQNQGLQQAFAQSTGAAYQVGGGNPAGAGQPTPAAPPVQPLDGRSATAATAINTQNNLAATMAR